MDQAFARAIAAQRIASTPGRFAFVSANAGSGKTKVLVDRVARLLLEGVSPDSILCVTYTRAAAVEMQSRLFATLGAWSVAGDEALAGRLRALDGAATEPSRERLRRARRLFARALETPGGLRIETVHAFCQRVLTRFPLEAGLSPGFEILDEAGQGRLFAGVIADLQNSADDPDSAGGFGFLYEHMAEWAEAGQIDSLLRKVLAAPGGIHLSPVDAYIALGADPRFEEIDILRGIVDDAPLLDLLQAGQDLATIGGKNNLATAEAIRAFLTRSDQDRRGGRAQGEAYEGLIDDYLLIFCTKKSDRFQQLPKSTAVDKKAREKSAACARLFGSAGGDGAEAARIGAILAAARANRIAQKSAVLRAAATLVSARCEDVKRRKAGLDFTDLITLTLALMHKRAASAWVAYKLDGGISHILVDEAQDTAPGQWELLAHLWGPFFDSDRPRTVFAVGDDKQSIYSFQGAEPERFWREARTLAAQCATHQRDFVAPILQLSFRSACGILSFVDEMLAMAAPLLADDGSATEGLGTAADIARHEARRAGHSGRVELWAPFEQPEARDLTPWTAPVDHLRADSARAQLAEAVAREAARILADRDGIWEEMRDVDGSHWRLRAAEPQDILILTRERGPLFELLLKALKRFNVPVAGADRVFLADSLAVQDLLALGRFAIDPADDLALAETLKGPLFNLTDEERDLFALTYGRVEDESLWTRLRKSPVPGHRRAAQHLEAMLQYTSTTPWDFYSFCLESLTPNGARGDQAIEARLGLEAREHVAAFMARARGFSADRPPSLALFVNGFEEQNAEVKRELSAPRREARIMTVHGAKGLEAPIVFLPDCAAGPHRANRDLGVIIADGQPFWVDGATPCDPPVIARAREKSRAREWAEFKRLFYVGATRARDRLVICAANAGKAPGKVHAQSWYALAQSALERLRDKGQAAQGADPAGRSGVMALTIGPVPEPAHTSGFREERAPAPPEWLVKPVFSVPGGLRLTAPSRLGATYPVRATSPLRAASAPVFHRGRLTHILLQILPDLPRGERMDAGRQFLARHKEIGPGTADEILAETIAVIADPRLQPLFGPGSRAEAAIIGRSPRFAPGIVINGRVDRLAITKDRVIVADYKTNRPPPVSAELVPSAYIAQMAAYHETLRARFPESEVEAWLVWTDGPIVTRLPSQLLEAALSGLIEH